MEEKEQKTEQKTDEVKVCVFKKKEVWISGIIGILIGAAILFVLQLTGIVGGNNKTIVKSKAGNIKEGKFNEKIYNIIKTQQANYVFGNLLDEIDNKILSKKYKLTDDQRKEINDEVEKVLNDAKASGVEDKTVFNYYGCSDKEDFTKYMELSYKKNLCYIDYCKTLIPKEQIEEYYNNNNKYGKISTKYILIQTADDSEDSNNNASSTANEIITRLNNGESFDDLSAEYYNEAYVDSLDFDSFEAPLYIETFGEEYINAAEALEAGSYTKEAVKGQYGYFIIQCNNKEDAKKSFEEAENEIVEILAQDLGENNTIISLIKLREEYKVEFKDSDYKKQYEEYCSQANSSN